MRFRIWWLMLGSSLGSLFFLAMLMVVLRSGGTSAQARDAEPTTERAAPMGVSGAVEVASANPPARTGPVASSSQLPFALTFAAGYLPLLSDGQPAGLSGEFHHAEIGDITGDGRNDLISFGETEDAASPRMLYVYPQLPTGVLGKPLRYAIDGWDTLIGISLGDMNNDGIDDVVMTHTQGISLALSDQTDGLRIVKLSSTVADKLATTVPAVALDLNNDGALDLISHLQVTYEHVGNTSIDRRSRFRIVYGDRRGGTSGSEDFGIFGVDNGDFGNYDSEKASSLIADDFNADGYLDLAMSSRRFVFAEQRNPPFISIYLNNRAGSFSAPNLVPVDLEYLGSGDFNNDGRRDLVAALHSNRPRSELSIYLQTPLGTVGNVPSYGVATYDLPMSLDGKDLDGDGADDLLVGHDGWATVGHFLQKDRVLGSETLNKLLSLTGRPVFGYLSTHSVAVGDLNGDGCNDVAVAARFDGLQVFAGGNCVPKVRVTSGPYPARRRY